MHFRFACRYIMSYCSHFRYPNVIRKCNTTHIYIRPRIFFLSSRVGLFAHSSLKSYTTILSFSSSSVFHWSDAPDGGDRLLSLSGLFISPRSAVSRRVFKIRICTCASQRNAQRWSHYDRDGDYAVVAVVKIQTRKARWLLDAQIAQVSLFLSVSLSLSCCFQTTALLRDMLFLHKWQLRITNLPYVPHVFFPAMMILEFRAILTCR